MFLKAYKASTPGTVYYVDHSKVQWVKIDNDGSVARAIVRVGSDDFVLYSFEANAAVQSSHDDLDRRVRILFGAVLGYNATA